MPRVVSHPMVSAARPRVGRFLRRRYGPRSRWHQTMPAYTAFVELRWRWLMRRGRVQTPAEHAAAFADPTRRGAAIEIPIRCGLCDGQRLREVLHVYDHRHDPPKWNYHVVRCAGCGFLFRHPGIRPERLGDLYSGGKYAKFLGGKYTKKRILRYELTMEPFGELFARGDGRRLLDFGCGNGLFLDLAHERGFACHGVDLAEDAIAVAVSKPSGAHTYHGSPQDIPEIAAGGFDVITMWSVLAHLATPLADLTMLRRLLAPDGVLLILTVNAESLALKRALTQWGGFTPNHLLFSSPKTLPKLLARAGFGAVVMPPWYGEQIEHNTVRIPPRAEATARRAIERGNRGNMLRAAAFASSRGPSRWGLQAQAQRLS